MTTYNVDETRGLLLIKALGSYYNKYYKQKNFVRSLCEGYEELATQLEIDLQEIADQISYEKCPLEHNERYRLLDLTEPEDLFLANEKSTLTADVEFPLVGIPVANLQGYKIDPTITSIKFLTDKIIEPTLILEEGTDFVVLQGVLYINQNKLPKGTTQIWASDILFKIDVFHDVVGFLFFDKEDIHRLPNVKLVSIVLLKLLRYGLFKKPLEQFFTMFFNLPITLNEQETVTSIVPGKVITDKAEYNIPKGTSPVVKVGETYEFLTPITNGVSLKDAAREQYYIKNGKVYVHDYILRPVQFGKFKWGKGKARWGIPNFVEDTYDEGLLNSVVYRLDVKMQPDSYPFKYLDIVQKFIPVWLHLNVIIETPPIEDEYNSYVDSISHANDGVFIQDRYGSIQDGTLQRVNWGATNLDSTPVTWGNLVWGEKRTVTSIVVIHQQHE